MTLDSLLSAIEAWGISQEIRETSWFPIIETVHVLALTIVVGSISMLDLRLLGFRYRDRDVAALTRETLPWTWIFFALAIVTGSLMFISRATLYGHNPPFQMKLVLLVLAGTNMLTFHATTYRSVSIWGHQAKPPVLARLAGGLSLTFWVLVVAAGRWIGFTT